MTLISAVILSVVLDHFGLPGLDRHEAARYEVCRCSPGGGWRGAAVLRRDPRSRPSAQDFHRLFDHGLHLGACPPGGPDDPHALQDAEHQAGAGIRIDLRRDRTVLLARGGCRSASRSSFRAMAAFTRPAISSSSDCASTAVPTTRQPTRPSAPEETTTYVRRKLRSLSRPATPLLAAISHAFSPSTRHSGRTKRGRGRAYP